MMSASTVRLKVSVTSLRTSPPKSTLPRRLTTRRTRSLRTGLTRRRSLIPMPRRFVFHFRHFHISFRLRPLISHFLFPSALYYSLMTGTRTLLTKSPMRRLSSPRDGSMMNPTLSLTLTLRSLKSGTMRRTVNGSPPQSVIPSVRRLLAVVNGNVPSSLTLPTRASGSLPWLTTPHTRVNGPLVRLTTPPTSRTSLPSRASSPL